MPPKKMGAAAKAKVKANTHATRASVPDTITTNRGKEYETTAALSRPRRESAILPSPVEVKETATATPSKKRGRPAKVAADEEPIAEPAKKRGRPAKASVKKEPPKKRGRPPKKVAVAANEDKSEDQEGEEEDEAVEEPVAAPRPRGRPPKKAFPNKSAAKARPKPSAKRGRPFNSGIAATEDDAEAGAEEGADDDAPPPKKRGRPSKKVQDSVPENETPQLKKRGPGRPSNKVQDAVPQNEMPPPKKRGSSPRGGETTKIDTDDDAAADQLEDELIDTAEHAKSKPNTAPVWGKGTPAKDKGKGKGTRAKTSAHNEEEAEAADEGQEQTNSGTQYWLMKAEQEDREETLANGEVFNTKFTIDDLKSKAGPEPWDGVRNPVAAKNMRTMKKGDLAFFYASGGKSGRKPGIVGIMEIVKEHEPDQTAWDEGAYGYVKDEKSRGKWCVVHVEYRKKLSKPVHLSELQQYMQENGGLSEMQVLKQSRLSVTKVSEGEWNFITETLIEGFEEESDALPEAEGSVANGNAEEESTLITTEQPNEESSLKGAKSAGLALSTTEGEIPSTDTIFPVETSRTSRPVSRGGSRAPSIKPKATASRQGSRAPSVHPQATTSHQSSRASSVAAGSLAPPVTNSRGRSRTPSVRAGSAATINDETRDGATGMQTIGEHDE